MIFGQRKWDDYRRWNHSWISGTEWVGVNFSELLLKTDEKVTWQNLGLGILKYFKRQRERVWVGFKVPINTLQSRQQRRPRSCLCILFLNSCTVMTLSVTLQQFCFPCLCHVYSLRCAVWNPSVAHPNISWTSYMKLTISQNGHLTAPLTQMPLTN